ncbi:hypothetical protein H0O02_04350 [Candidatus Micrarchaeota archaeon]|nr:hypothetical protein [Candidatus Micrarchaeota archaeon]
MNMKPLLVLLLLSGFSCAIILSGDAGEEWSKNKSQEMCARSDVAGVYICLGNTVDVVWKDTSKGSTFYRPDGRDMECQPLEPTEMGAECMQLMMPNYCTLSDNVCGERPPEEFPGGETEETPPQQPPAETPPAEPPPSQLPTQPPVEQGVVITGPQVGAGTGATTTTTEGTLSNLVLVVFALAVIALIVLYFVFRRTTRH